MKTNTQFLSGSLLLAALAACSPGGNTISPVRKNITEAVYASGKIYPAGHYKVFSKLPGYIQHIHIKAGDAVAAGQPLITILNEAAELSVSTAKNILDLARNNADEQSAIITAMKQEVASAKSKYELDSANYARFSNLLKSNATSPLASDQAKTQADISKQNYTRALNTLRSTKERLGMELKNAENQYQAQLLGKKDFTIFSVMTGIVYDVAFNEGELIGPQLPLMEIGDPAKFEAELLVDETDVARLTKGQQVLLSVDAFKEQVFKGTVQEIYPRISLLNKTSKVIASLGSTGSAVFYSGMSAEANILISEKQNALVIPREFIFDANKVRLKKGSAARVVKKGIEDLEYTEILSGIDEKDVLVKP